MTIETRIVCGEWWGKGEPLLIATSGSGRIAGVSFSHIRARSDNSIVVVGSKYSVSNIALQDWDLTLRYGLNRPLYGRFIDVQPAPTRPALDAEKRIPWLYAAEVKDLLVRDIRFRSEDTPPRDLTASITDVIWSPGASTELIR